MTKITAKNKEGKDIAVEYDLPEDLAGLRKRFGDEVVGKQARSSIKVSLQSYMRSLSNAGKSAKDIQTEVTAWLPSSKQPGKSKAERAQELYDQLSEEEKANFLANAGK